MRLHVFVQSYCCWYTVHTAITIPEERRSSCSPLCVTPVQCGHDAALRIDFGDFERSHRCAHRRTIWKVTYDCTIVRNTHIFCTRFGVGFEWDMPKQLIFVDRWSPSATRLPAISPSSRLFRSICIRLISSLPYIVSQASKFCIRIVLFIFCVSS